MPDPVPHFDLVVLGAGPAGETAAVTAARLGKRVCVVEKEPVPGGAAINTGTVPSKTLRETAVALSGMRSRDLYGVDLSLRRGCTIDDFLRHERGVKHDLREYIARQFDAHRVVCVRGTGRFSGPNEVAVTDPEGLVTKLHADRIVIAIGSAPFRPPGFPFAHNRVHDSDELLGLHHLPRSLAVVGAGVIGSEYACMFAALGVRTTLIDGRSTLLPFLDPEMSSALESAIRKLGVDIIWNEAVTACDAPDEGDVQVTLSGGRVLGFDHVLICAGRTSRTADLNPAAAGLILGDKGRLCVDAHYCTNLPHVYAVGDVIGFPALASTSAEQGRQAALHAFGAAGAGLSTVLPTGIYTIPEVSCAGATEPQLAASRESYLIGRARYSQVPRGRIIGDGDGFLKLLVRRDDLKLLGVHVLGEQASEVVHVGLLALTAGLGADIFTRTCFNYPTLGELYQLAAHDALSRR